MKTRTLATVVILAWSVVLASCFAEHDQYDWYQGRRGRWYQEHNAWRFDDEDGNEYRQEGNRWDWYSTRTPRSEYYH